MEHRYAKILNDDAFKIIILAPGNERLLTKIIQLLIPDLHITGLRFNDKEQHGLVVSDKNVNFDLLCTTDDERQFIVELQSRSNESYADRMLSYATFPIRTQLAAKIDNLRNGVAEDRMDYTLLPVYVVSLINFKLPHKNDDALDDDGLVSRYSVRNNRNSELMTNALNFVYLEMGRLKAGKKEAAKCRTLLEQFAWSVKYMHEVEEIPEGYEDELLKMLYTASELANMPIIKRKEYDDIIMNELDQLIRVNMARDEGRSERNREVALKMKAEGLSSDIIERITGLSESELDKNKD
ncbi:MAG: PD-(D/E)XK nuclease family transposase [Bacteroidales bacterium]|nr:PD-(D/E)XK nuclease family transposase [Bacteroidales bacterium]